METLKAIEKRKSIRSYLDKPVDKSILEKIISTGNKAPGAGAICITVITNKEFLKKIDDTTLDFMKNSGVEFMVQRSSLPGYRPLYDAPAMILVSADAERGAANAITSATTMILAATDLGLGTCYVVSPIQVIKNNSELLSPLGLPDGILPVAGVLLGYTDDPHKYERDRAPADNITYIE